MDKRELVDRVFYEIRDPSVTKAQIADVVSQCFDVIQKEVSAGNEVSIRSFGAFCLSSRKETRNKNPITGEWQTVPARMVPKFKPSEVFKREVRDV